MRVREMVGGKEEGVVAESPPPPPQAATVQAEAPVAPPPQAEPAQTEAPVAPPPQAPAEPQAQPSANLEVARIQVTALLEREDWSQALELINEIRARVVGDIPLLVDEETPALLGLAKQTFQAMDAMMAQPSFPVPLLILPGQDDRLTVPEASKRFTEQVTGRSDQPFGVDREGFEHRVAAAAVGGVDEALLDLDRMHRLDRRGGDGGEHPVGERPGRRRRSGLRGIETSS